MNAIARRLPRLAWSYENAEALKWIAFACMVVDHANKLFAAGAWAWAVPIGRIAFPLFAFVIGRHLGDQATAARLLRRLLVFGAIATPAYLVTLGGGDLIPPNILFTFALALVLVQLLERDRWILACLVAAAVPFVDYAAPGVALVIAAWCWWQRRSPLSIVALALSLAWLCWFNGNAWALLSVPIALLAALFDWRVARHRWFFWIAYPAHLVLLAAIAFGV